MYIFHYWWLHKSTGIMRASHGSFISTDEFLRTMARWNNNKDQEWIYFIKKWPQDMELAPK